MLILWIVTLLILLCSFTVVVLSRLIYKLRKFSTVSSMVVCFIYWYLFFIQTHFLHYGEWVKIVLYHNVFLFCLLIASTLYQFVMTIVRRKVSKWDSVDYMGATMLLFEIFPWYFIGLVMVAFTGAFYLS